MIKKFDILIDHVAELPIRDVVEKYTGKYLQKKGNNYTMVCPFCGMGNSTPCFFVNERKNICKCYSCQTGADSISFVQKYMNKSNFQSIKTLADDFGISYEIEEKERTPEEEENYRKKEAAFVLMDNVAKFYATQLANTPDKLEYVKNRFGQNNLDSILFGYASNQWDNLVQHSLKNQWNTSLMIELGLLAKNEKNGKLRDVFRNRIMIPIEDKRGRIIGFTARNVGADTYTTEENGVTKEHPIAKYVNSSESFLFHKGEQLFGYSLMKRSRCEKDKIYIVEGASDVLAVNNVRIYNVVAPMGTALTDAQLELLQKEGIKKIAFIPDQDIVKPGEKMGIGMINALKNAKRCIQKGFFVTIKLIPSDNDSKDDPGSFFTDKGKWEEAKEEDFLIYYANKQIAEATTLSDKDIAIKEIANLLKYIKPESLQDSYISKFSEMKIGKVKLWKEAINQKHKEEIIKKSSDKEDTKYDLYTKYGFMIDHKSYKAFKDDGSGATYQWSNFIMEPLFHIKDAINPKRMYKIENCYGFKEIIEMKQEELTSMNKFKTKIEGLGNFIWEAGERELIKLKKFLYQETKTAYEITQLGWQKSHGIYCFGNGIYNGFEFKNIDNFGIVEVNKNQTKAYYYLPAMSDIFKNDESLFQFERRFVHNTHADITLYDYATEMVNVFGQNAKVGLIFLFSSLFKDIIVGVTKSFPLLKLFGPKGAGKSEMGHSLMSFFVKNNQPVNINSSTRAALGEAVAQVSNALVHLDEFKNNIDLDKREFLKGIWDNVGRSRMNMEKDKKREMTSVDCGVIVSGQEMATADIALFSRLIFLCFTQTKYNDEEKQRFQELKEIERKGLSHITLEILSHREQMIQYYHYNYNEASKELLDLLKEKKVRVEDRIFRNWLTLLATYRTLHTCLNLPFSYEEIKHLFVKLIIRQNKECESNNELAEFWDIIAYLNQRREIYLGAEFRICTENILKLTNGTVIETKDGKEYLYLNKKTIFQLYQKQAAQGGTEKPLAKNSLIFYLSNSPEYIGEKNTVRFRNIIRGMEEKSDVGGQMQSTTMLAQAMIFDYQMVKEHYEIDLDVYGDEEDEPTSYSGAVPEPINNQKIPF